MSSNIWSRDRGVVELVKYFSQPDIEAGGWERLAGKPDEFRVVQAEIAKCRNNFRYTARNYFHIQTKQRQVIPFKLWESQELLLEKVEDLKAKGKAQKVLVLKARQLGFCLDPNTRVLTADLKWVKICEVRPGQELIATDEEPPGGRGAGRKMRTTTVIAKEQRMAPVYRITLEDGRELVATGEHRFLCKRRGGTEAVWMHVGVKGTTKKSMSPMRVGDEIRSIAKPWEERLDYEDGWFGGLMDGEGSFRRKPGAGVELCVSQVPGPVYDRALSYMRLKGYPFREELDTRKAGDSSKFGNKPVAKIVLGRMGDVFQVLAQCRPVRLGRSRFWEGMDLPGRRIGEPWVKIVSIEKLPEQGVIDLQTDTGTFIAEGFVSHNSTLIEALMAWRVMYYENVSALIVSHAPTMRCRFLTNCACVTICCPGG